MHEGLAEFAHEEVEQRYAHRPERERGRSARGERGQIRRPGIAHGLTLSQLSAAAVH